MAREERHFAIICDDCNREIPKDDEVYYCNTCGCELCEDCAEDLDYMYLCSSCAEDLEEEEFEDE